MATILEFRPERTKQRAAHGRRLPLDCEVVLFPGVRYEYSVQAADVAPKGRRKAVRKRDKIDLK